MILTVAGGARSSRATPSLHEPHLRTTPYGNQQQIHLKSVENCPNKPGHLCGYEPASPGVRHPRCGQG